MTIAARPRPGQGLQSCIGGEWFKKTTAYWLVNKGLFEVRIVRGKQRVMVDSFNEWLEGQTHYRIVRQPAVNDMDGGKEDGIDS